MYRLMIISLLGIMGVLNGYTQSNSSSIVLYCDDTPYLIPEVENILNDIKHAKTATPFFNKVTNLTRLRENLFDDLSIDEFITSQVNKVTTDDPRYLQIRNTIIGQFNQHDFFLKVNIHKLGELLEFQFILYETLAYQTFINDNPDYIFRLTRNLEEPKANYSIFINPKEADYLTTLRETIKKIFPKTNTPPVAVIRMGDKAIFKKNAVDTVKVLSWDINDTLIYSGVASYDEDTPVDLLVTKKV